EIFEDIGTSKSFLPSHNYLVNKDIMPLSGLWNENLKINQDGEFFVRVILSASVIYFASQACVYYRKLPVISTSSFNILTKAQHSILSWKMIEIEFQLNGLENNLYIEEAKNHLFL